jgi:acetyl esterase/lipase
VGRPDVAENFDHGGFRKTGRRTRLSDMPQFFKTALAIALATVAARAASAQIRVERDIKYTTGASYADNKDKLDIFIPPGAKSLPVIVSLYGGALTAGDKSEQPYVGERFAEAGYVAVLINYRLSPTVAHPAHAEDAATAVAWVKKNIAKYGGDPNKIVLTGHSAGAYLISLLLLDPRYLAAHGMKPSDIRGAAPVSAFFYVERTGVGPDRPKFIWGADPKAWPAASPASYVRADVPPMLLLYADGDDAWRRGQQSDFAAALRAAGDSNVETHMIAGRTHLTVWYTMEKGQDETSRAIEAFAARITK